MKKVSLLAALAVMMGTVAVFAQEKSGITVSDSAVCTAIADRMPEGTAAEFSKDTPKIYYWTKVEGAEGTEIKHIWYAGETSIGEVPLKITTPSFRTWSSKTIYPGLEGDLSVVVVDADGNVLKKDAFQIK
ncbi:MAG: DUF2914 domain-containing protein [Endomicrobium sp.]|jgi:hypothetical protein|nr:DUF2914 domain-containing protein [Endomicrobium sp.]